MHRAPPEYISDPTPTYPVRIFLEEFRGLDPWSLPWRELRKYPERFPQHRMAKVASARTVVGYDFETPLGPRSIYLKRSYVLGRLGRIRAMFRATKEWREFILAHEFGKKGIWVPRPLYYSESVSEEGYPTRFIATQALEPAWREAKSFFLEEQRFDREWKSLAHFARRLHDSEMLHADFRADHVYFEATRIGVWDDLTSWALIDLDGSRTTGKVSKAERLRALRQLAESLLKAGMNEAILREFLDIYDPAGQYGFDAASILAYAMHKQATRPAKTK